MPSVEQREEDEAIGGGRSGLAWGKADLRKRIQRLCAVVVEPKKVTDSPEAVS